VKTAACARYMCSDSDLGKRSDRRQLEGRYIERMAATVPLWPNGVFMAAHPDLLADCRYIPAMGK
jgi:hypothetical protein